MHLKIIGFTVLALLLSACDVSGSDFNNSVKNEKKSSNTMSNNTNRLSYLEAKKLSVGFLGAELSDENQKNILKLEEKGRNSEEINAKFVLALMNFYDGNNAEKNESLKVFYKLAELGHPYAALEFVKYTKSDSNSFKLVKRMTNLTTEQLNIKVHDYLNIAISHNINAAYYYYAEYLLDSLNNQGASGKKLINFSQDKKIVEHIFLSTSSYLGNIPDLNVFLIYTKLLLNNELKSEDVVIAKALVIYFNQIKSEYDEEKFSADYIAVENVTKKIDLKYPSISSDNKEVKKYIDKIQNTPKVFISDWIEKEIDYK